MVFSDPIFIVGFLPVALILFHLLRSYAGGTPALIALVGLSLYFYAYWNVAFMFLLLAQICANYLFARGIERRERRVLVGRDAQSVAFIQRLFPVGYWPVIARLTGLERTRPKHG